MDDIRRIVEQITEQYEVPIRIGSRCESSTFYHVNELSSSDIETCGAYISERVEKLCEPVRPNVLIQLHGSLSGLASVLSKALAKRGEELEIINYDKLIPGNGVSAKLKNANVVLVNDVITTARSCVEIHTKVTMMHANVLCWAAIIDRTFGPGPVPVVAAFTGEPVRLLEENIF